MRYKVEVTDSAWFEIAETHEWLTTRSKTAAQRWLSILLKAVDSLEQFPERCGLAPESDFFQREIRQLLCGNRRNIYRVLFEIVEDTVVVLRVRHAARRFLGEK